MLFLVRVGTCIPYCGPSGGVGEIIGVVEALSKAEAARKLGLLTGWEWDGWKLIPGVDEVAWSKWGRKYFFTPFDTKRIDRNPKAYATVNRRMRVITLHRTKKIECRIPEETWVRF